MRNEMRRGFNVAALLSDNEPSSSSLQPNGTAIANTGEHASADGHLSDADSAAVTTSGEQRLDRKRRKRPSSSGDAAVSDHCEEADSQDGTQRQATSTTDQRESPEVKRARLSSPSRSDADENLHAVQASTSSSPHSIPASHEPVEGAEEDLADFVAAKKLSGCSSDDSVADDLAGSSSDVDEDSPKTGHNKRYRFHPLGSNSV